MVNVVREPTFRQSYTEPDIYVRGPTGGGQEVPGVEFMQGFEQSKDDFETYFLKSAPGAIDRRASRSPNITLSSYQEGADALRAFRSFTHYKKMKKYKHSKSPLRRRRHRKFISEIENGNANGYGYGYSNTSDGCIGNLDRKFVKSNSCGDFGGKPHSGDEVRNRRTILDAPTANCYADKSRRDAARLQRCSPPDLEGAGRYFERAVFIYARHGLFCTRANAMAHLEYAQNLSRRCRSAESEYHLRTAASIYRLLNLIHTTEYADALLFIAVLIDQQCRLEEAENFYRSSIYVYTHHHNRDMVNERDSNARIAIDALCHNLRMQGRPEEVDDVVKMVFNR